MFYCFSTIFKFSKKLKCIIFELNNKQVILNFYETFRPRLLPYFYSFYTLNLNKDSPLERALN